MENIAVINVATAHLLNLLKTAETALYNAGFNVVHTDWVRLPDGTAIREMFIDADVELCAENNFLIADKLTEEFEDTAMNYLSIVCRPLVHHCKINLL